jgi:hypothetical protein
MRSWEAHGFSPRLILSKPARRAVEQAGGGLLTTLRTFNCALDRKTVQIAKQACVRTTQKLKGLKVFPANVTREDVAQHGFI